MDQCIDYEIDPSGRRIGKRKDGQVQYRLLFLDKLHPLAEFDHPGNIRSLFVYADRSNAPTLMLRGGKTWRLIADHLSSIRQAFNAETGRWTAKDPIFFEGGDSNLYGYVLQDPVNLKDPNGLIAPAIAIGIRVAGCAAFSSAVRGL